MKLRQFCLIILIFISSAYAHCMMESSTEFTAESTKFAFDFHGVVVTEPVYYFSDAKKLLCWDLIPACNRYTPWFVFKLATLLASFIFYGPAGKGFEKLCSDYQQEQLLICIKHIGNSFELLDGTIKIIQELRDKGYEIDLASNIDMLFLQDLENSQDEGIQALLALFSHIKAVDCSGITSVGSIRKPNINYFNEYQEKHNPDKKTVIFIDDRYANIAAAKQVGMYGIIFSTPEALRDELEDLGILEAKKTV